MSRWPKDNQAALIAFYGDPGSGEVERQLVTVTPPFKMYYEGKQIRGIRFHQKAAGALAAALAEIWDRCGRDQQRIDALGISRYAGSYNRRYIRGSSTKWSNHAYGAAIDLNAEENGFGAGKGNIPALVVAAFKRQGARWGGDYKGRTDPMHFEFCDNGEPDEVEAPQVDSDRAEKPPEPAAPAEVSPPATPMPPVIVSPPAPSPPAPSPSTPAPVTQPWYKRVWAWAATSLFGGGFYLGGFKVTPELILAVCLLIVVIGTGVGVYLVGKRKEWW